MIESRQFNQKYKSTYDEQFVNQENPNGQIFETPANIFGNFDTNTKLNRLAQFVNLKLQHVMKNQPGRLKSLPVRLNICKYITELSVLGSAKFFVFL